MGYSQIVVFTPTYEPIEKFGKSDIDNMIAAAIEDVNKRIKENHEAKFISASEPYYVMLDLPQFINEPDFNDEEDRRKHFAAVRWIESYRGVCLPCVNIVINITYTTKNGSNKIRTDKGAYLFGKSAEDFNRLVGTQIISLQLGENCRRANAIDIIKHRILCQNFS